MVQRGRGRSRARRRNGTANASCSFPFRKNGRTCRDKGDGWRIRENASRLHVEAERGDAEAIRKLLASAHGASNVNVRDREGETPLHKAAGKNRPDIVRLLVEHGADPNRRDALGTPLEAAVSFGAPRSALVLAETCDVKGTPLHLIAGNLFHCLEVAHYSLTCSAGEVGKRAFPRALSVQPEHGEWMKVMRLLIGRGASVEARDARNKTPLHCAAGSGVVSAVRLLLDHGADTEARDDNGATPLHIAVHRGHVEAMLLLLERGANTEARDGDGAAPLHTAVHCRVEGSNKYVAAGILLDRGADIEARNGCGDTPLKCAAGASGSHMVDLLAENGADRNVLAPPFSTACSAASDKQPPPAASSSLVTREYRGTHTMVWMTLEHHTPGKDSLCSAVTLSRGYRLD